MKDSQSFRIGKRSEIQLPDVRGSYEIDWNSLDELIDLGLTRQPVRAFPVAWMAEAAGLAKQIYATKSYCTALKSCELAVSRVYQRRRYSPSWNAPLFPEQQIMEAAGNFTRTVNGKKKKQRSQRREDAKKDAGTGCDRGDAAAAAKAGAAVGS